MEEKVQSRNRIIKICISIFVVLLIGVSIAYFMVSGQTEEQTIATGNLDLTFTEGDTLRLTNNIPIRDVDVESEASEVNFTVKNSGNVDMYASIYLDSVTVSDSLKVSEFRWALYEGDTKITTGNFLNDSTTFTLSNNQYIAVGKTKGYTVRIWVKDNEGDQTDLASATFSAKVTVKGYSNVIRTLGYKVLGDDNANVITTAPTFSTSSGLYVQKDDIEKSEIGFPTYYYRGAVTNNYVSFAEQIWRIVRVNEDGSIKLVTQWRGGTSSWDNTTFGVSDYIQNYGTNNESDSAIKISVESWYNTNIGNNSSLDSKVVTSAFCSDKSMTGLNYNSWIRLFGTTISPIFTCPNGAIIAQEKVGLITADELVYSGVSTSSNLSYFDDPTGYLTLTPSSSTDIFVLAVNQKLIDTNVFSLLETNSFHPVINLSPDVIVSGGSGTEGDPYVIR